MMEDYRKTFKKQAEDIVKQQLTIEAIIEAEKIEATEEDVDKKLAEMAEKQGKKVPDLKKDQNPRQLDYIKNEIIIQKLFDTLKGAAVIE